MKVRLTIDRATLVQFRRQARADQEGARKAARRYLTRWGRDVVKKARPDTPVDDEDGGELRASVRSSAWMHRSGSGGVSVLAGGKKLAEMIGDPDRAAAYPWIQHEDVTLKHRVGGPKFIEKHFLPAAENVPRGLERELAREGIGG